MIFSVQSDYSDYAEFMTIPQETKPMARKSKNEPCCAPEATAKDCCKIESLLTVDERGQMVLPKELRDRANIRAGDKLALISWLKDGDICCFTLIKADSLAERVREFLGPVLKGMSVE
jgi:antitoxin PrlF